jgi:HEAT repeat protein
VAAALADPDADIRRFAVKALGAIGPPAAAAAPALLALLADKESDVQRSAEAALTKIQVASGRPDEAPD